MAQISVDFAKHGKCVSKTSFKEVREFLNDQIKMDYYNNH